MSNSTCPTWCVNRAAVPHSLHTADVAEFETPTFAAEITLSQNDGSPAVVRVYTHTHDNTTMTDLAPAHAAFVAELVAAMAPDSPRAVELAEALTLAAATIEKTGGAA